MTLDKHQIDGLAQVSSKILPASAFEQLMTDAGYTRMGSAPAKGNRVKVWWSHPNFSRYVLLVRWTSLEAHTIGFRKSPQYQDWKKLLHHFYDPFPDVEHFVQVELSS